MQRRSLGLVFVVSLAVLVVAVGSVTAHGPVGDAIGVDNGTNSSTDWSG